jgi:nitroreductase
MKKLLTLSTVFLFLLSCTTNQKQEQTVTEEPQVNTESQVNAESQKPQQATEIDFTEFKDIVLLKPDTVNNDAKLMDAFKKRESTRKYSTKILSLEHLSNLLWAAQGINRIDGRRTSPSAYACYPITIYAVFQKGIYAYDAEMNTLHAVLEGDYRTACGEQDFVYTTPLNLVYVANMNAYVNFSFIPESVLVTYAMADAAHCSENVYLYCAASDLKTIVHVTGLKEAEILQLLKLGNKRHRVLLSQTVGYEPETSSYDMEFENVEY